MTSTSPTPNNSVDPAILADAEVLWAYHRMDHEPRKTEIAIGLGSHDIGVADHAAKLFHEGRFPRMVFTGANAPTTKGIFPRGEAVHYRERALELGVPDEAIIVEPRATNTGENFQFTREILAQKGISPQSATIISRPYQQRRAYATCKKQWPELDIVCSSQSMTLREYIDQIGDANRVINMLVGDTQRIKLYADEGFAVHQECPPNVLESSRRLIESGFDARLVK